MNRRAVRLAAFSLLLPVPVAMAVPQSATVPTERLVAMSSVPLSGVGDTVLPRVMPVKAGKAEKSGPSASLTKVSKREQAQAFRASEVAANGVPQAALRAYRTAEATMAIADPSCELSWALLAGVGRVESDHGRYAGAVLGRDGVSDPEILGLPLNGVGPVAAIADTDAGSLDGDKVWDRAVGPMQFIPSTWAMVGVDGDGDNQRNPHDLDDAALAAAAYLCVGGNDLSTTAGMQQAVYSYNHSAEYVTLVLGLAEAYQKGLVDLPALAASPMSGLATGPGVDVGLNEGRGLPIGTSDDASTKEHARPGKGDSKADGNTKEHGDQPAGNKSDWPNRPNDDQGNDQPRGGSNSTPPRGNSDGGNGTEGGNNNGDTGGGNGGDSGNGSGNGSSNGGGDNDGGGWLDKPKPSPEPKPTPPPADDDEDDGNSGPGGGDETEEPTEPTEPPETEEPEPSESPETQKPEPTESPETQKPEAQPKPETPAPVEPEEFTGELVPLSSGGLGVETDEGPVYVTDTMKDKGAEVTITYDPETLELIP